MFIKTLFSKYHITYFFLRLIKAQAIIPIKMEAIAPIVTAVMFFF